jgi:KaiC/GvpD/RAD55 family RecA-like ATPase
LPDAPRGPILGLPELDEVLAPCLPAGWLGLLGGPTGAEASLLAKQFAAQASADAPAIYYTTHERTDAVRQTVLALGGVESAVRIVSLSEEYFENVLAPRLEVSRIRERGLQLADLKSAVPSGGPRAAYNLTSRILADLAGLDRPFRLVLDSLDFLLEVLDLPEVMTIARQTRHRAQSFGAPALLVLHGEVHERRASGLLEGLADVVLEVMPDPSGVGTDHSLRVRKVRNHPELKRTVALRVTPTGFELRSPK